VSLVRVSTLGSGQVGLNLASVWVRVATLGSGQVGFNLTVSRVRVSTLGSGGRVELDRESG